MSSGVMLKRKRTSFGMLWYRLHLHYICDLMLESQSLFQVLPFLSHCTCVSCADAHSVSKQAQRSTPWISLTFINISIFVAKIITHFNIFASIKTKLGNFLHVSLFVFCSLTCLCVLFVIHFVLTHLNSWDSFFVCLNVRDLQYVWMWLVIITPLFIYDFISFQSKNWIKALSNYFLSNGSSGRQKTELA